MFSTVTFDIAKKIAFNFHTLFKGNMHQNMTNMQNIVEKYYSTMLLAW